MRTIELTEEELNLLLVALAGLVQHDHDILTNLAKTEDPKITKKVRKNADKFFSTRMENVAFLEVKLLQKNRSRNGR